MSENDDRSAGSTAGAHPTGAHPTGPVSYPPHDAAGRGQQTGPGPYPPHGAGSGGQPVGFGPYGAPVGPPPPAPLWGPPSHPTNRLPVDGTDPGGTPTGLYATPAPAQRSGGLRMGVAGLIAGAVIGGGTGAGVATLLDEPAANSPSSATGQSVVIENPQTATTASAAAAKAAPSVVTIYVQNGSSSGSGSGVVLSADGFVLTNNHVVAVEGGGTGSVQVRTADGTLYEAQVVGTDPSSDLAVLRLDGAEGLPAAEFADSEEVQVGDVAVAIGAPLGLSNTVTDGIISATDRAVATGSTGDDTTVIDALQTDAAINPGNSGGALVDAAGQVIGINTAIATVASGVPGGSAQSGNIGVGFAIPSNTANRIADEIIENGSATRAFLGVSARTASGSENSEIGTGAEVVSVEPGSAADDAGLREGDVITAVGDRAVTTSTELTAAVRSAAPGDTVTLTVRRGGQPTEVEVRLGETG